MLALLIRLILLCLLLSGCVQKTDSSLSIDPSNYPTFDFQINDGASTTNNRLVKLKYTSSRDDVSAITITQGPECIDSAWLSTTENLSFNLTGNDGEISISAKVKTPYGFQSNCVTKKINLDTTGPKAVSISGPKIFGIATSGSQNLVVGDALEFNVSFNENAIVVGTPSLSLNVGGITRQAKYSSGSGSKDLIFKYEISLEDQDFDGLSLHPNLEIPVGSGIFDSLSNLGISQVNPLDLSGLNVRQMANMENNSVYIANGGKPILEGNGTQKVSFILAITDLMPVDIDVDYVLVNNASTQELQRHNLASKGTVRIPANTRAVKLEFDFLGNSSADADQTIGVQLLFTNNSSVKANGRIQSEVMIRDDESSSTQYKEVSAGQSHTCAITSAGLLRCWGLNDFGQLGDGTTVLRTTPVNIDSSTSFSQISSGFSHSCAITAAGKLKCWGKNQSGQLGDGTTNDKLSPISIDAGASYSKISTGEDFTCGILTNGTLKCWGNGNSYRLGDGSGESKLLPTVIDGGTLYSQISVNGPHACGITTSGVLKCWGYNGFGQLGDGTTDDHRKTPTVIDQGISYSKLKTGSWHTCGITQSQKMRCWGYNGFGQIGDANNLYRNLPFTVDTNTNYSDLALGDWFSCGLTSSGQLKCWGQNHSGQLGVGNSDFSMDSGINYDRVNRRPNPTFVMSPSIYRKISTGGAHSCGIESSGILKCWGSNTYGQLGVGKSSIVSTPKVIEPTSTYQKISQGYKHSCGITTAGVLKCWGANFYGQLGDQTKVDRSSPIPIDITGSYADISAGGLHTCGITLSGELKCWGDNYLSQLGDGTSSTKNVPTTIDTGTYYSKIATGHAHSCGITTTGTLKCWGQNKYGEVGDGSSVIRSSPITIDQGTTYSQISCGKHVSCAITTGGSRNVGESMCTDNLVTELSIIVALLWR